MKIALKGATIYTGTEKLDNHSILIEDKQIAGVVQSDNLPEGYDIRDLSGLNIAPGLIDLQIYGSGGKLFGSMPDCDGLEQMENDLLKQGTTGFMATSATNSTEVVLQFIDAGKEYRKRAKGNYLGLHLEGPFLNPVKKGAHPEKYIKKAELRELKSWVERAEGELKMITIAPELQDQEILEYLDERKIIISAGHSNASYEEASSFFNKHVKAATHLYNAMPQIHHREGGLVAAIFEHKPFTSIIADGIHVSYPMIALAKRELGDRLFLITDAVTETSEGIYPHVYTGDRYTMPDGTLSGSCLSMLSAVKNCVQKAKIDLEEALRMGSTYPAELINKYKKGRIEQGYDADLIIFDSNLSHHSTYLSGKLN